MEASNPLGLGCSALSEGPLALANWGVVPCLLEYDQMVSRAKYSHEPVLLEEVVHFLQPTSGGCYVDCTLGAGGHAAAVVHACRPNGEVVALDRDATAIEAVRNHFSKDLHRIRFVHGSFRSLPATLDALGWDCVDGVLADLGLSSVQLSDASRGFSFGGEGPLDMRFDVTGSEDSALELVNEASEGELKRILSEYGEERRARSIARRIVLRRPIHTTTELRRAVISVTGPRRSRIDPATRTFQAIRIAVNDELAALDELLEGAVPRLAPGGRVVILSYHSLEDRLVKHQSRRWARENDEFTVLTKKPVIASELERHRNPRARSAKLRVIERRT